MIASKDRLLYSATSRIFKNPVLDRRRDHLNPRILAEEDQAGVLGLSVLEALAELGLEPDFFVRHKAA